MCTRSRMYTLAAVCSFASTAKLTTMAEMMAIVQITITSAEPPRAPPQAHL